METIEEKSIKRIIEVNYEDEGVIRNRKLHVDDKTLHALFIPPQGALEEGYVLNFIKSILLSSLRNLEC